MIDIRTCFTYAYNDGSENDFIQAINTAEEQSTNIINLDVAGIRIAGGSKPPWWILRVIVGMDVSTSIEIKLLTATAADGTTGQKCVKIKHFLAAAVTAGALIINEPLGHFDYQQYMGLLFTCQSTGDATTVCSWLQDGPESAVTDIDEVEANP